MGGFGDWVGQIAGSDSAREYRQRVGDPETASRAYCMSLFLRRIRLRGSPRLLRAFARCFPS